MAMTDNLKNIISRQREALSALEAECQVLESSDLALENNELKAELERLRMDIERVNKKAAAIAEENTGLKNTLYAQIYSEKVKIVDNMSRKLDIYFRSNVSGERNKLTALEKKVRERIDNVRKSLVQSNLDISGEMNARLDETAALLERKVSEAWEEAAQLPGAFTQQERDELEALKNEQITDDQVRAVTEKSNLERFVGLNVLNAVGIFLLLIGVITLGRYTFVYLPDLLKGVLFFTLGGAMLAAGEVMNRKKPNVFSLGVSAGGIAILYAAMATSVFGLKILDLLPAVVICVLITAVASILSVRYSSQVIAIFALIGGYLPMFSIYADSSYIYGAMVYFVLLNLLVLLISFNKKWIVSSFIGLAFNIFGTIYICQVAEAAYHASLTPVPSLRVFVILYVLFAFLIYTCIPIVSTLRTKAKFRDTDIALLAINTIFSCLIMYNVFYNFGLQMYHGLLALIFAAAYLLLGTYIEKKFAGAAGQRSVSGLFYLTGLTFVILVVPLQFGTAWLSLGWLAEGVLLAVYGIMNNEERFKQVGFVISGLCLAAFVCIDCLAMSQSLFVYKYSAITLGSIVILGTYMYKKLLSGKFVNIYKYFVLANLWFFIIYLLNGKLGGYLVKVYGSEGVYQIDYLITVAAVITTFTCAYVFSRIRLLSDLGTKVLSCVLYVLGIIILFAVNTALSPVSHIYLRSGAGGTPDLGITLIGTAILVVVGLISVFALRDLLNMMILGKSLTVEYYPMLISGYFVIIVTQNLITQFNISFASAAISIIYALTALGWIIFGFMRRYSYIRLTGLGLAILSVFKLFIVDLFSLTQGYRILSYFALGLTLLAISFVYQYFSKKLLKETDPEAENGGAENEK